jgi:hypothetical protein
MEEARRSVVPGIGCGARLLRAAGIRNGDAVVDAVAVSGDDDVGCLDGLVVDVIRPLDG